MAEEQNDIDLRCTTTPASLRAGIVMRREVVNWVFSWEEKKNEKFDATIHVQLERFDCSAVGALKVRCLKSANLTF